MTQEDLLFQIPNKLDDTVCLYVDDVFINRLDVNQVNQYRINVLKYIYETGDSSILNRFYFVGHKDTNDIPGEEIKMKMDEKGNFSDFPYEMAHVRRHMRTLLEMERKYLVNEIVSVAESPSKTFPRVNQFEVGASYRH